MLKLTSLTVHCSNKLLSAVEMIKPTCDLIGANSRDFANFHVVARFVVHRYGYEFNHVMQSSKTTV